MRVYKKESGRLKKVQSIVKSKFPHLGINKKQEITRLLYEISKREAVPPHSFPLPTGERVGEENFEISYNKLKHYLLKRRYPHAYLNNELSKPYLPKVKLDVSSALNLEKTMFYPKRVFVEKSAFRSRLANRFRKSFPEAVFSEIKSLKDYLNKQHIPFSAFK